MRPMFALALVIAPLMLASCADMYGAPENAAAPQTAPQVTAVAEPLYVRRTMQADINPAIVGIWAVGNNAMNETGGLDGALMTEELWTSLAASAGEMTAAGEKMAAATDIRSAAPDNMATEDYETSMADIQSFIDADPQAFRDMAANFAQLSRNLETAAIARDVEAASPLVAQMDAECAVCHAQFWYAEAE